MRLVKGYPLYLISVSKCDNQVLLLIVKMLLERIDLRNLEIFPLPYSLCSYYTNNTAYLAGVGGLPGVQPNLLC